MVKETIAKNIRRLRELMGWTQLELGLKLGYSPETARNRIYMYEKNRRSPNKETISKLAQIFNVTEADLYTPYEKATAIPKGIELDQIELRIIDKIRQYPEIKEEIYLISEALSR